MGNHREQHVITMRRSRQIAAVVILGGLAALGCVTTAAPPPKPESVAEYRVGAPDQLQIIVLPDPVMERGVTVRPDGMISMDLIGDLPAGGRTLTQISADLEKRLSRFKRDAKVTVSLVAANSTAITVMGEVRSPSTFPLLKQTRASEAIGQVGGPTTFGRTSQIRVIRSEGGEAVVYRVDLDAIQKGDLSTNILLAAGDLVYVPPTPWARVGYAVNALLFPFSPLIGVATSFVGSNLAN